MLSIKPQKTNITSRTILKYIKHKTAKNKYHFSHDLAYVISNWCSLLFAFIFLFFWASRASARPPWLAPAREKSCSLLLFSRRSHVCAALALALVAIECPLPSESVGKFLTSNNIHWNSKGSLLLSFCSALGKFHRPSCPSSARQALSAACLRFAEWNFPSGKWNLSRLFLSSLRSFCLKSLRSLYLSQAWTEKRGPPLSFFLEHLPANS